MIEVTPIRVCICVQLSKKKKTYVDYDVHTEQSHGSLDFEVISPNRVVSATKRTEKRETGNGPVYSHKQARKQYCVV
jgi:hypothetical protein